MCLNTHVHPIGNQTPNCVARMETKSSRGGSGREGQRERERERSERARETHKGENRERRREEASPSRDWPRSSWASPSRLGRPVRMSRSAGVATRLAPKPPPPADTPAKSPRPIQGQLPVPDQDRVHRCTGAAKQESPTGVFSPRGAAVSPLEEVRTPRPGTSPSSGTTRRPTKHFINDQGA